MQKKIRNKFQELFSTEGSVYASPGRINLIGEHTDYNGGFVFPGAIDKGMIAEIKPNGTGKVRAFSVDLNDYAEFGLNEEDAPKASWARYIFGVCRETIKRGGQIQGFDTVFAGDVPLGAGMSSSAALESTYAFALNDLSTSWHLQLTTNVASLVKTLPLQSDAITRKSSSCAMQQWIC